MLVTNMQNNNQNNLKYNMNIKEDPNEAWNSDMPWHMDPNLLAKLQQQQRQELARTWPVRAEMNINQIRNTQQEQQISQHHHHLQQQQQQQQQMNVQQHQQQQLYQTQQYQNYQQSNLTPNNCNNQIQTTTLPSMNFYNTSPRNIQHMPQQLQTQINRPYVVATPTPTETPTTTHQQQHHSPQQLYQHQHQQHSNAHTSPHLMQQTPTATSPQQQRLPIHSPHQRLVSVDGIQSGVPTLTTSTLTPTTLRSIEETFIQLVDDPVVAPFQAGFIPPSYASTSNNTTNNVGGAYNGSIQDCNDSDSDDSLLSLNAPMHEDYQLGGETTDNSSATTDSTSYQNGLNGKNSLATSNSNSTSANDFSSINFAAVAAAVASGKKGHNANTSSATTVTPPPTTRRNQGGRRPAKQSNLSPEEEEKRRVRRERNKLAAARCRKRRVDLTNDLLEEVSQLENRRDTLQKDIESLNTQKQELEYILEAHRPTCQKIRQDIMTVNTFGGLIVPTTHSNDSNSNAITGMDTTLASTGRGSPIDLKPDLLENNILTVQHIKNEPLDIALDSNSLDHDGPTSPKRLLLSNNNPMVPPPLPKIATLSPSLAAAASASLHTPIVSTAPMSFAAFGSAQNNTIVVNTLNALHKPLLHIAAGNKQRPTTLPTMPRNPALGLNVQNKPPTDINGVAIQTPSTGMFNFDSLMDGGTGLTPVSGPLIPNCSSQNKHPLELTTPTSEPSKLVSL